MRDFTGYIESLESADIKMTKSKWLDWIKKEDLDITKQDERHEPLTSEDVDYILNRLDDDGFIE